MTETEGEIEYLEEDAEIVQQCVQYAQLDPDPAIPHEAETPPRNRRVRKRPVDDSLLVERPKAQKRKKVFKDDDSEYDPIEDEMPPSPPSPPVRKRRPTRSSKKPNIKSNERQTLADVSVFSIPYTKTKVKEEQTESLQEQYLNRKKFNIRIPDFEDPLCLPVRALKTEESDKKRLTNWNNVCLEHFKHCDSMLKPERGHTKGSTRTAIFKFVINKLTGNSETTIWSKTSVENKDGDKKSEIFQCILPRYREKKVIGNYMLSNHTHTPVKKTVNKVILSKEEHKDGEALVVYKPEESLSAVYGLVDKRKKSEETEEETPPSGNEECQVYLQELTACRVCTPCFQNSWRGQGKYKNKALPCPLCGGGYASVSNLMSHLKSHPTPEVLRHKNRISHMLADIVSYQYKCRVCRKQLPNIKTLREHLLEHQCKETFTCEVCSRLVN